METTDVTFFELSEDEIAAYVVSGEPMDKAGAYGIREMVAIWFRASRRLRECRGTPRFSASRELVKFTGNHDYLEHALAGRKH